MKTKQNRKGFISLIVLLTLVAAILLCSCFEEKMDNEFNTRKGSTAYDPYQDREFSYDRVLVVLTRVAANLDKEWTLTDFPGFAFSKIEYQGIGEVFIFYLAEPNRENVVKAIDYLNQKPEIISAELDWLDIVPVHN